MKRTAAAILALLLALAPLSAHAVVPGTRYAEMPDRYGLQFEPVEIPTPDKATVFGWWFAGRGKSPVLVLAPGATGTMASLLPVAREFHDRGFSVLTFDYRDFGPNGVGPQDSLHYVVRSSRWITDMQGALENIGSWLGVIEARIEGDLDRFKHFIEERGAETGAWRGTI